jgi:hypothetical protein
VTSPAPQPACAGGQIQPEIAATATDTDSTGRYTRLVPRTRSSSAVTHASRERTGDGDAGHDF